MKPYDFVKNGVSYTFTPLPDMAEEVVFELYPEARPRPTPPPLPTPVPTPTPNTGLKASITSKELNTMNVQYSNGTPNSATLKIRVGSTDRPDRIVAAGKTVTSTYTTTIKTGFVGQKLTVLHVESSTTLLEQIL
jgi:hypothetical protein